MATIHTATDDSFQQDVLESGTPVLVDFWAEWCGPCKMIAPVLEQLSEEYGDDLKIVKVNVDENSATPGKFDVRGIPTLILFKDGEAAAQKVGALSKTQLKEFIDANV